MAIGISGGDDQGTSLEVQVAHAKEVGQDVLNTARKRHMYPAQYRGEIPTFLFLEPGKFSKEFVDEIESKGEVGNESVDKAKRASFGLSVEAALQVLESRPTSNRVVDDTHSLHDIGRMLDHCEKFAKGTSQEDTKILASVAGEIAKRNSLNISGERELVAWASQKLANAKTRIDKSISIIEDYNR